MISYNKDWSNVGGCAMLHPFNAEKRAECEAAQAGKAKNINAQADLLLAQAAANKAAQPSSSWTAGQTAMVVGASLIGLTVMIVIIKKMANKNK